MTTDTSQRQQELTRQTVVVIGGGLEPCCWSPPDEGVRPTAAGRLLAGHAPSALDRLAEAKRHWRR